MFTCVKVLPLNLFVTFLIYGMTVKNVSCTCIECTWVFLQHVKGSSKPSINTKFCRELMLCQDCLVLVWEHERLRAWFFVRSVQPGCLCASPISSGSDLTGCPMQAPSLCPPPEGEKNPASIFHVVPCEGF